MNLSKLFRTGTIILALLVLEQRSANHFLKVY